MNSTAATTICDRCHRVLAGGLVFALKTHTGDTLKCLGCALRHFPLVKRSLAASLVVGTILPSLNQGDSLFVGRWNDTLFWKIPLTYVVPYMVSAWGALSNARR